MSGFWNKSDFFEIFCEFFRFLVFSSDFLTFFVLVFCDFLRYFWIIIIIIFLGFFLFFLNFWDFFLQVSKVTTNTCWGYYWSPKNSQIWAKTDIKRFFCTKAKKGLGRSPPQELEEGTHSGPHLLVYINYINYQLSTINYQLSTINYINYINYRWSRKPDA